MASASKTKSKSIPMEKRTKMKKMFEQLDKDGDGYITAKELAESVKECGKEPDMLELEGLVETADKDGDEKINFTEFIDLMASDDESDDEELREIFNVYDVDESGCISVKEVENIFRSQGIDVDEKTVEQFKAIDKDGDGTITFEEFKEYSKSVMSADEK